MNYMDSFKSYWEGRFASSSIESLLNYEGFLSEIVDNDTFFDNPLQDEILIMHRLACEECILRLASYVRMGKIS